MGKNKKGASPEKMRLYKIVFSFVLNQASSRGLSHSASAM